MIDARGDKTCMARCVDVLVVVGCGRGVMDGNDEACYQWQRGIKSCRKLRKSQVSI